MRIKTLLKSLFCLLLLFQLREQAQASHLYGGEFTYEYLGQLGTGSNPFRYRITLKHYVSLVGSGITPSVNFNYYQYNSETSGTFIKSIQQSSTVSPVLPLPIPSNCPITFPQIVMRTFVQIVDLPLSFTGYYVTAVASARNGDITNIFGGSMSLYMQIPPPSLNNPGSSPVFTDTAVVVIFAGDTTSIINSAFDADGDRLIYAFNEPYDFNATTGTFVLPPSTVTYRPGYSFAQPFGVGGYASINASTGLARYYVPPIPGNTQDRKYVISFQVKEYRNLPGVGDILIGSSIRDIQLVVKDVPPNSNSNPNFTYNGPKIITITEGSAIPPINFTFTDPNAGQLLKITASSPLLDGVGGKNATFNTSVSGPVTINNATSGTTATFNYTSVCGDANNYPLDITVQDNACPPGKKVESFQIVVVPYDGPQQIFGDTVVCMGSTKTYNITGKASANYNWKLAGGGTIIGNKNNDSIQVNWTSQGRFKLTAIETSTGSCTDSISFFVNVTPGVTLALNASATTVCNGTPVTITASGGTNYSWTDGTNTFTGSTLNVTPATTTTYTVSGAGITGCSGNNAITITVNQAPNVDAGANRNVCQGTPTTLTATGASTYSWTDGVSTFTGNNISVSPTTTTTYTVTGTNTVTGCTNTDQVTLTVSPVPAPSLSTVPNQLCKNAAAVTLPANTTIDGIAASTLNPATLSVGNHVLIVSETNAANCTGTATKTVTINAVPTPDFGTLANAYCKDAPAVNLNVSGNTYQIDGVAATAFNPATLSVGNHTVVATALNAQGCSQTTTRTVAVNPVPTPSLAFLATAYCKNAAAVTLTAGTGISYTIDGTTATSFNPATLSTGSHTVIITEVNSSNCSATTTKTVTVNPVPTPDFGTLANAYCKDAPAVNLNVSGNTYQIDGVAATAFNPATLSVGNHTVVATALNAQGCSQTTTRTVAVNPVPTPSLAFLATAYCKNAAAVTLTAGTGISYTIDGTTATTFNPATLSTGNHTVIITEVNSSNCSATTTKTVTVNPVPAPAFVSLNASYCQNAGNVTLSSTLTGSTFTIDGTAATILNPATLSVGNHTVVVSNTNTSGCTGTSTQTVQIKAAPTANFGSLATGYCKNATAFSLNIAGSTFTIDGTAATSFDPATLTVGNHTVAVVTTNADGCSVTGTRTVAVYAIPAPSLAFLATTYCKNAPAVTLPAATGVSYSINNGPSIASGTFDPAVLAVGTNTITLTETNGNACTVTTTKTITINPAPLADIISGPTSICPGLTGVKYKIDNPRENNYQWLVSTGNGTIVSGQGTTEITVNWNGAAAASVSAQAVNVQGCVGPAFSLPVTINPILITPLPVGPTSICKNQANNVMYVMPNPTHGSSFTWSVTGGTVTSSNTTGDTVYINWTNVGTNNIIVQEASSGTVNCFGSSPAFPVTILPSPNPALVIAGPTNICLNTAVNFSLAGAANSTYAWSVTQGTSTTPLAGNSGTSSFTATAPGAYTITVLETNANGCAGTPISKTITVEPTPTVTQIFGDTFICPENLNNLLFYVQGPAGRTYTWQISGGTMVNPGSTNDSIYVNFDNVAGKQITVTPISANGCNGTPFTMNLTLDGASLELANVSTGNQDDKVVELSLQMPGNNANTKTIDIYRRESGSQNFTKIQSLPNTATTFTDNNLQTSNNIYEYRLESFNECGTLLKSTSHNTMVLQVSGNEDAKTVSLSWNAYKGWNVTRYEIYAQADNGNFSLVQMNNLTSADTMVTLNNISSRGFNQCFRIKAISADARVSWSNKACVNFVNELKFYNVITPNNDGYNDAFVIENIQLYPGNEISIFNRWGTEVYRKSNYDNTWNAGNLSAGTYYYLVKLKDGRHVKGWVEVIK